MCFTKRHETIGEKGAESLCNLTDGGKTNKNHNQHYTAMIGTKNPLIDAGFARGGLNLHRFLGGPSCYILGCTHSWGAHNVMMTLMMAVMIAV